MKLSNKKWLALSALLASATVANAGSPPPPAMPPVAAPSSISYDFIEAGYVHSWNDLPYDVFDEGDGYQIGLNKSLTDSLYLFAGFGQIFSDDSTSIDTFLGDIELEGDLDTLGAQLGLGFHLPLTSTIDWVIEAGGTYARTELDVTARLGGTTVEIDDAAEADGFGFTARTGFRIALTNWLELDLFYRYLWADIDGEVGGFDFDIGSNEGHVGEANLIFRNLGASNLDLVLGYSYAEEAQAASAGIRYNF